MVATEEEVLEVWEAGCETGKLTGGMEEEGVEGKNVLLSVAVKEKIELIGD